MLQSKLSTKGQVIIPKPLRTAHNWQAGQRLQFIDTPGGFLENLTRPLLRKLPLSKLPVAFDIKGNQKTSKK